jgi:predicted NAD/FAD-binding protein
MRIAIVGSGVSSLCAAYYLRSQHDIVVFEANDYLGGHVNTVEVETPEGPLSIDTGFIVFNERTYPNFCRLLAELGVESQASDMSFSVRCQRSGLEYAGTGFNGLFAQRSNLLRPGFWRLLWDWRRFGREAPRLLASSERSLTVREFFRDHRYSPEFRQQYFFPIGSAIWSCPHEAFEAFPIRFIVDFYHQHGLLTLQDPPIWRVIRGGSQQYVRALARQLPAEIRLRSPVRSIQREPDGVRVGLADGSSELFDHVVLGCHADQSLRMLGAQATPTERQVLSAFRYEPNTAVLHTDSSVLPQRRAWASWNYCIPRESQAGQVSQATVTYLMNRLQGLTTPETLCVSLNQQATIDPHCVLRTIEYHHPVFSIPGLRAQQRHRDLIDHERISYCGAYWGNGFHEDGVNSALAVSRVLSSTRVPTQASAV